MASTFLGLSITSSGLNAAQIGLTVTTNNMSNVNTTGYSRQLVNQTSVGPAAVYSSSLVGSGVDVTSVDRERSDSLDQKYWQENSASNEWKAKSTYLSQIETVFGSTTDDTSNSISTALNTFNTDLETLANDPTSTSDRAAVLEEANTLCSTLNDTAGELTQLRSDVNNEVKTTVEQINSYTTQIADLNRQVMVAKASGASTNDLKDQEDELVDKLSGLAGVTVTSNDNGGLNISLGDSVLVNGSDSHQLECYTVANTSSAEYGMYGIRDSSTGQDVDTGDSGALNGYLEIRDGSTADSKGIPYYSNQLDYFARTLAEDFNEGVTVGTTTYNGNADGYGLDNTTGIRFFSYDDKSSDELLASGSTIAKAYQNITAANISVSSDIQNDQDKIAASSTSGETSNNTNLEDMIDISSSADIFKNSTATGFYSALIATIGTASSSASTAYSRKSTIVSYINTSRSSVSAVSSNEETINLTKYQSAYAASASMTSAWSKIYDETIDMVVDS